MASINAANMAGNEMEERSAYNEMQSHKYDDDSGDGATSTGLCRTIKITLKRNVLMLLTLIGVCIGSADALMWISKP